MAYLVEEGIEDVDELEDADQDEVPGRVLREFSPHLHQAGKVDQGLWEIKHRKSYNYLR